MEKHGDFSVSAIQTLTICVRKCQRKQGSDDPDFQYQRGTKNLMCVGYQKEKKCKDRHPRKNFANNPWIAILGISLFQHRNNIMSGLSEESLLTLEEAARDFGGISIPLNTIRYYAYQGVGGLKLETIRINRRYTSKEAIQRFIAQRQNLGQLPEKPKSKRMTPEQIDEGLRKYGIRR